MQSAVAKADAQSQLEKGTGQAGEVLAHRATKTGKGRLDKSIDGGLEFVVVLHH